MLVHPVPPEGRIMIARIVGTVAVDAGSADNERRTAKTCGPDAAALASMHLMVQLLCTRCTKYLVTVH